MFLHYLKIAFRNLLKFKSQTIISVLGLAIGFTAFAFTMSWIRYEMGYDSSNPDADRIYRVVQLDEKEIGGMSSTVPEPLAGYLKAKFPEVEEACYATSYRTTIHISEADSIANVNVLSTDTSFFRVFYPEIKPHFRNIESNDVILAYSKSFYEKMKQFNKVDDVDFSVPDKGYHTNVSFDKISFRRYTSYTAPDCPWCTGLVGAVYVRLQNNSDVDMLSKKLKFVEFKETGYNMHFSFRLIPLREAHYSVPTEKATIRYEHLKIFAIVSLLVILCGLFNYLMLFVNKIKIRSRELALRKVNASSEIQLIFLLFVEFLLVLIISLFVGGLLTEVLHGDFMKFSQINAPKSYFIKEMLMYGVVIMSVSVLTAAVPVLVFMKRSIRENIQPETKSFGGIKNRFTLISIFTQLTIGVLLIFCTLMFLRQLYFLNNSDIGFNRHNVVIVGNIDIDKNELNKIPDVENAIVFLKLFLPKSMSAAVSFPINNDTPNERIQTFEKFDVDLPDFLNFFEIKLLEGRNIKEGEIGVCLINETARKLLGPDSPIGKKMMDWIVVGVIPDLYTESPLLPVLPGIYRYYNDDAQYPRGVGSFAYRYSKGKRAEVEQTLRKIASKHPSRYPIQFNYMDDIYSQYTKSERYLLILLGIMSSVAVLIAIFGIYSMITLACSQRRKEIAVRKVNGAKIKDILSLFFKQYFMITVAACLVALPAGAYIMKQWLQQYTRRISMDWWLFTGVFLLAVMIVFLSIFFRVWRTAKENPAEVVKSE